MVAASTLAYQVQLARARFARLAFDRPRVEVEGEDGVRARGAVVEVRGAGRACRVAVGDQLLPLLAPSAPFCVWSYTAQPLAEALDTLRRSSSAVNLSLQEPWLRKHQVLPRRTHPTMTTTAGSGGYVLSGNVIPEAERKRQRGDDDETAVKRARTGDS